MKSKQRQLEKRISDLGGLESVYSRSVDDFVVASNDSGDSVYVDNCSNRILPGCAG